MHVCSSRPASVHRASLVPRPRLHPQAWTAAWTAPRRKLQHVSAAQELIYGYDTRRPRGAEHSTEARFATHKSGEDEAALGRGVQSKTAHAIGPSRGQASPLHLKLHLSPWRHAVSHAHTYAPVACCSCVCRLRLSCRCPRHASTVQPPLAHTSAIEAAPVAPVPTLHIGSRRERALGAPPGALPARRKIMLRAPRG